MKPILKFTVCVLLTGTITFVSCFKEPILQPVITPPPLKLVHYYLPRGPFGTFYSPDSVAANELMYKNILWQMDTTNYDQVLPLDISAMTSPYTEANTKVYVEGGEVFDYWTNWGGIGHGMFYAINATENTIHIYMDENYGWALDPHIGVSVLVKFQ